MLKLNNLLTSIRADETPDTDRKDSDPKRKKNGTDKTELEILVQRKQTEVRTKALHNWSILRDSVCSAKDAVAQADKKDVVIMHGIHRERKLNHQQHITQVIYIPEHKEYLTCDGQYFRFFHDDGRKKDVIDTEEGINRVIYSNQTSQFVGWVHGQEDLYLMHRDFVIQSSSKAIGRILLATYNHNTGELITVGPHFITCWAFRYGARHLIPRLTTKTNFGERKMFKMMVLEETASRTQRMFFAQGNGVVVYNVFSGLEMCHKKELHAQPVTALTFFNPLKYVITGAKDGCIKIWDKDWKIKMVFVGHNDSVSFLKIHPHGPAFISASLDCTIRVWNMDTCDEVDKTAISEPIQGMGTEMNYDIFYTFAGKHVDLWKLQHLYQIHTNIGYRVNNIKVTTHPSKPPRAVLLCRDGSVRITCPANGEVLTTLLLQPYEGLVDAAYAIAEDIMFTVLGNGDILKCDTAVNPCQVIARWPCNDPQEMCNYLLVYEYVVDPTACDGIWAMMKRTVQNKSTQNLGGTSNKNRTLLLGGRKDGYICVFDWQTGGVTFQVEAHGSKGVLNMIANSKSDQLVSAGMDNIIKVWRLYPFAQEALAPLMSFYCAHTPSFMTTIKSSLGVAFQDPGTATFSVVLYSLPDKRFVNKTKQFMVARPPYRSDHKPDDDHMDLITGLTSCPRMKLYASCSMDGTIRIWNESNDLIRLLKINTIPHSISFCSPDGDLLVGISNHLFVIPHKKYLPQFYIRRQACMKFPVRKDELPIEFDENRLSEMDKNDVKRLKNSHASFKFDHFVDILSAEEEELVMRDKKKKEEAFILLANRDEELEQIKDGRLISTHKPKSTKRTQNRAFREYMKIYYNKEREKLPPDTDEQTVAKRLCMDKDSDDEDEKFRPDTAPYGFFSELSEKYAAEEAEGEASPLHPSYPMTPCGYLPNSVLIKIMYPPPTPKVDPKDLKAYTPPELSSQQRAEIENLHLGRGSSRRGSEALPERGMSRQVTFAADEHLSRVLEVDLSDDEDPLKTPDEADMEPAVPFEFDESMRPAMDSGSGVPASSGAATIATPAGSSGMTVRTFSDLPDSRFTTPKTPAKTPAKSRLSRKKTSFLEDEDDDEDDVFSRGPGLSEKSTSLLSKFQEIMDKEDSDKVRLTKQRGLARYKREEPEEPSTPTPAPVEPPKRAHVMPTKPITKLVSRPRVKMRTPTPPRSPTPPPPPTPLPNFIKQFVGTEWFDKYLPNCNENTLPKPWTSDTFVSMIVKLLRISEWLHKVCVTEAILFIHTEEGLSDPVIIQVVKTLGSVLNHHTNPPSCAVGEQKNFIMTALRALANFAIKDKEVIAEMMVQFLDGDRDVRASVVEVMTNLSLSDPHRQFQKELDSWDIWSLDEKNHRDELHRMCNQWLDRWMTSYKMRIKDTVDKLNTGHQLHGRLAPRGSITGGSRRSSIRRGDDTLTTLPEGASSAKNPTTARSGRVSSMSHASLTVTVDNLQGSAIMESVNYIDAINYFCEMMTEKELEALRRGQLLNRQKGETVVQAKNTVLVLPKIARKPALVRLGEMHTSKCRPERETALHTDFRLPPITSRGRHPVPGDITGFVPSINLPMKCVYLNPFPSAIDALDPRYSQPILITLKSSQKYFIPSQSHVPIENNVAVGS